MLDFKFVNNAKRWSGARSVCAETRLLLWAYLPTLVNGFLSALSSVAASDSMVVSRWEGRGGVSWALSGSPRCCCKQPPSSQRVGRHNQSSHGNRAPSRNVIPAPSGRGRSGLQGTGPSAGPFIDVTNRKCMMLV